MSYWDELRTQATAENAPSRASYWDQLRTQPLPQPPTPIELQSDPSKAAGISDIAVASLANDPKAQIRYYARQRGISEDRYKIIDGHVAYRADDGQYYREVPALSLSRPRSFLQSAATGVGPSFPAVGGAVGGALTLPLIAAGPIGLAASMAGTGAAAAGGQAWRETLAQRLMEQEPSPTRMIVEGGSAALGQGIGAGLSALASRNIVPDIGRFDQTAASTLREQAKAQGITLTPAEETNLASLKAQQKYLGNIPASQDKMATFYEGRTDAVKQSVQRFLNKLSPVDSAEEAGELGIKAAGKVVNKVTAERAAQAAPLYKQAFEENPNVNVRPVLSLIDEQLPNAKGEIKRVLKEAESYLFRDVVKPDGTGGKTIETTLGPLHSAKLALDALIEGRGEQAISRVSKAKLIEVKNALLQAMDDASPVYKQARAIYADMSPGVERVREGLVGKIDDLGVANAHRAAAILMGPQSGETAVIKAMDALKAVSPEAAQALKRSYLQGLFEKAMNETVTGDANVAGQFRKAVIGNFSQSARIRAALDTSEWKTLNQLTDVLEAASRVKPIGSDTAWNEAVKDAAEAAARTLPAKIVRNMNPAQLFRSFDEWSTRRAVAANAEALADVITQPGAADIMKQLRITPRGSPLYRMLVGHLVSSQTTGRLAEEVD